MSETKKKLYLSGPITGRPIGDVITEFSLAQSVAINAGYEVFNPLSIAEKIGYYKEWIEYMKYSIEELSKCDCIWFFSLYHDSKGVAIERAIAKNFGIKIIEL